MLPAWKLCLYFGIQSTGFKKIGSFRPKRVEPIKGLVCRLDGWF
jgi:hypothetical protein